MAGRTTSGTEDVQAMAFPVRRPRPVTNCHAWADSVSTDDLVKRLLDTVTAGAVAAPGLRLRLDGAEDSGANPGQDFRVTAPGMPFIQKHLGRHRKALTRNLLLA